MTQCAIMLRLSARLYTNPQAANSRGAGSNENNNHNCSKITLCLGQRGWSDEWKKKYWSCEAAEITEGGGENKMRRKRNDERCECGAEWWQGQVIREQVEISVFPFLCISVASSLECSSRCLLLFSSPSLPLFTSVFFSLVQKCTADQGQKQSMKC